MVSADPGACTWFWGNWCECVGPLEYKNKLREWFHVGLIFCSKRRIDQQFIRASKLGQGSTIIITCINFILQLDWKRL